MSDTKIFSMGENSGSNNGIWAVLPALMQRQGVDPGLIALCQGRGGNGANGGWGDGIFGILLLFILFGAFRGNGGGLLGGGNGGGGFVPSPQGGVVPILNNDANTAVIMQSVQRNGYDISSLATALNTSSDAVMAAINALGGQICNLGTQMGQNTNQIVTAVMQGDNGIISQICSCCCDLKTIIGNQGYENRLAICNQTNTLQTSINTVNSSVERGISALAFENERQTCTLKGAINDGTQAILAGQREAVMREMQNKIDSLREENSTFKAANMTSTIVGQATAPLATALADLSARLAKIECNQPPTFPMPYCPAAGNYVPVNYGINVNPLATAQCGGCC